MDHITEVDNREGRMRALGLLLSRQSVGMLEEPAPQGAELDLIFDAALRAPDHGRLRPWRFVLIRGEVRTAFVDLMVESLKRRGGAAPEAAIQKTRERIGSMPLIVSAGVKIKAEGPIPEV